MPTITLKNYFQMRKQEQLRLEQERLQEFEDLACGRIEVPVIKEKDEQNERD